MLTTREVIKTFYNALLQRLKKHRGNWEQNDPTADDYIKNRPFYTDETSKETVVSKKTFTTTESDEWCVPFFFKPIIGQVYTVVWDEKLYECIAYEFVGDICIGNLNIADYGENNTGEPFFYYYRGNDDYGSCVRSAGVHTIEISTIKVVKLDKKYLPDLDLASVAKSGDYYDLNNIPVVFNDVVRYSANQSLTANQKNVARDNIGAASNDKVVKIISQTLTDTQKAQVRNNIGAGTSDFSGNYADLTNAPKILQANWEMYNPDSNAYIANKPFGYEYELEDFSLNSTEIEKLCSGTFDENTGLYVTTIVFSKLPPFATFEDYYFVVNGKPNISKFCLYRVSEVNSQLYLGVGNASLTWGAKGLGGLRDYKLYQEQNDQSWYNVKDTGEDWFLGRTDLSPNHYTFITRKPNIQITDVHRILSETFNQLDEKYIPDTIARIDNILQSDWNQNDPEAADYVKNRPFYTGDPVETVLVEESTVPFEDDGGIYIGNFSSTFEATVGETYNVSWDGYEYKCTCVDVDGGHIIGNLSIFGAGPDSGEPFVMAVKDGMGIFIGTAAASTSHTFSISGIVAPIVKIPAKYIDKDASGYIAIHKTNTMTEQEFQNYESAILSRKVVFIIWGDLCISNLGFGRIPDSTGAYVDFISITIINGERYRIVKNSEGVFDLADREISIASFPYNKLAGDRSSGITVVGEKVIISNSMISSGVGSTSALFKVEPNGMKSKAFEVRGNGEAVTPALILYSSTADSTKKFRVTVDDSGTISATEVT